MKLIILTLLCVFLILVLIVILLALLRTIQIQNSPQQKEFLRGTVPKELPNGLYKGKVGIKTNWQGKRFDRGKSIGINVFKKDNKISESYPFKTYVGNGAQDKKLKVIKIDYSQNQSPWWLKYILDEIVEISPGKYLGKLHIKAIPFLPLSFGFFRLEK